MCRPKAAAFKILAPCLAQVLGARAVFHFLNFPSASHGRRQRDGKGICGSHRINPTVCRWRRKSVPVWRAGRGQLCGCAMDSGPHCSEHWIQRDSCWVALRQLWLPLARQPQWRLRSPWERVVILFVASCLRLCDCSAASHRGQADRRHGHSRCFSC